MVKEFRNLKKMPHIEGKHEESYKDMAINVYMDDV